MSRLVPLFVFAVVSAIGAALTAVVYQTENTSATSRFEIVADEAVDRIRDRISQHFALLAATVSFLKANGSDVSRSEFAQFVTGLEITEKFEGVHGIGFVQLIRTGSETEAESAIAANYGLDINIWPAETTEKMRAPVILLEPQDARNRKALGYDMFAGGEQRDAIWRAIAMRGVQASAPVELVQEITSLKQNGFLVFQPLFSEKAPETGLPPVKGFVYAPFRAGDLHVAALGSSYTLPLELETVDTTNGDSAVLYRTEGYVAKGFEPAFHVVRSISVAGRKWSVNIHEDRTFTTRIDHIYSLIVAVISALLAVALAASARWQQNALQNAKELHQVSVKTIQEKDLILQEMKHRIKNSIGRILAIARQTASGADSIENYVSSFTARLEAMASAQDMLTRSRWQSAELRDLLRTELEQVFGDDLNENATDGPPMRLDERQTQALGLTFHELATNALKYGAGESNFDLTVKWKIFRKSRMKYLRISWKEVSGEKIVNPEKSGFGTRLIDANIKGELGGDIERQFHCNSIEITITIPLEKRKLQSM